MCRYPNPYMADRLGTTGPLLISSTNLVRILLGTVSILPKCNYIPDRITGSLCPWESGKTPTIFCGTIANELSASLSAPSMQKVEVPMVGSKWPHLWVRTTRWRQSFRRSANVPLLLPGFQQSPVIWAMRILFETCEGSRSSTWSMLVLKVHAHYRCFCTQVAHGRWNLGLGKRSSCMCASWS